MPLDGIDIKKRLGWNRQLPDIRDRCFLPRHLDANTLPPRVDLTSLCPPVVDQLNVGSCTGNAIAFAHQFAQVKQLEKSFPPSRLFIYYNERVMEGTISQDAGAQIRDGFKSISKDGVCDEAIWKYDVSKFAKKPPKKCYTEGKKHLAVNYLSVSQTLDQMKGCIADGFPFVFGFSVYQSFESGEVAKTGIVPMPTINEQLLGGHAVAAVGYDDDKQWFICRNSWGDKWGDKGYFYMPFDYLLNSQLASDFWTVRLVS